MSSRKRLTLLQKREIIEIANKPGFNSVKLQETSDSLNIEAIAEQINTEENFELFIDDSSDEEDENDNTETINESEPPEILLPMIDKLRRHFQSSDNVKQDWFSALNCMESSLVNSISQSKKSQPKITAFVNANNYL